MNILSTIEWTIKNQKKLKIIVIPVFILMIAGIPLFVYYTGGIKYVYSHSMYIPIVLAGFIYGTKGGIAVAVVGGVLLGPYMPIDTLTGEMQKPVNWIYRTGFFCLIGLLAGIASDTVKAYLKDLHWNARHDKTTLLPNRMALIEDFPSLVNNSASNVNLLIVASLNKTRQLKMVYEHDVIDRVVEQISSRFTQKLNGCAHNYYVYRADSDSIGALITGTTSKKLNVLLNQLASTAKLPFEFNGIPIHVDFRMGFIPFESMSNDAQLYLQKAESAMYHAHENMRDFVAYSDDLIRSSKNNMALLGELINALEMGQLSLHYQPKINAETNSVCGVEALMRWAHPERGNIPPGIFIPCAENSTLIFPLTYFAIEEALKQLTLWKKKNIEIAIAVNISPLNITQEGFAKSVLNLLDKYGIEGKFLELEVTEGALMMDIDLCTSELNTLANAGVAISIDDFGTGYSSLQYLHQLPVSTIKIDQSFVKRISDTDSSIHIVDAIIGLARQLGKSVVAEGVETKEIFEYLKSKGCSFIQGYYISRPMPIIDFEKWLIEFDTSKQ